MAMLANPEELALLAGVPEAGDSALQLALRRASDAFVAAVDWPVVESMLTHLAYGDGGRFLRLPARPVSEAAVWRGGVEDGEEVDGVLLDERLGLLRREAGWPDGDPVLVRYTAGWPEQEVPGAIQDVVLERALHLLDAPASLKQESTLGMSVTYADAALGVSQRWAEVVDRFRLGGDWS